MALAETAIENADFDAAETYVLRAQIFVALRPKLGKGGTAGVTVEYTPEMVADVLKNIRLVRGRTNASAYPSGKIVKIRPKVVGD